MRGRLKTAAHPADTVTVTDDDFSRWEELLKADEPAGPGAPARAEGDKPRHAAAPVQEPSNADGPPSEQPALPAHPAQAAAASPTSADATSPRTGEPMPETVTYISRRPRVPRRRSGVVGVLVTLGLVHLAASVVIAVTHRGPVTVAVVSLDAAAALALLVAAVAARLGRRLPTSVVVSLLLVAALASCWRGAVTTPWFGVDVLVVVLAAGVLPRRRTAGLVIAPAVGGWAGTLVVAVLHHVDAVTIAWGVVPAAGAAGVIMTILSERASLVRELEQVAATAASASVTDSVTPAANRRGLSMLAAPMVEHARRSGEAVHCLFLDVDRFAELNATQGAVVGDSVLVGVCEAIIASVRTTDVVCRWAGDQFVVIGPGTGTSPLEMERRIRAQLAAAPPIDPAVWECTLSIGSATLVPWDEGNIDSLLTRADQDMRLRRSLRRQAGDRQRGHSGPPNL